MAGPLNAVSASNPLAAGWALSSDTSMLLRDGKQVMALPKFTWELGTLGGGKHPTKTNAIGFTPYVGTFTATVSAKMSNTHVEATSDDGEFVISGSLCASRSTLPSRCKVPSLGKLLCKEATYFFSTLANDEGCVAYKLRIGVDESTSHLRVAFSVTTGRKSSPPSADVFTRISMTLDSTADEMLVGWGNQASHLDLKNASFPIISQENGIGRGDEPISKLINIVGGEGNSGTPYTSYSAVPAFLSSRGFTCAVEETSAIEVDTRHANQTILYILGALETGKSASALGSVTLRVGAPRRCLNGPSSCRWIDLSKDLWKWTNGGEAALPEWVSEGFILGVQGGSERVKSAVKTVQDAGVPLAGVWIQDWCGTAAGGF